MGTLIPIRFSAAMIRSCETAYISLHPRKLAHGSDWVGRLDSPFVVEIKEMIIALRKYDLQPREIRWQEPNGNWSRWEFLEIKTNLDPPVTRDMIEANLPKDWKK
jgi:hypothetical protein